MDKYSPGRDQTVKLQVNVIDSWSMNHKQQLLLVLFWQCYEENTICIAFLQGRGDGGGISVFIPPPPKKK